MEYTAKPSAITIITMIKATIITVSVDNPAIIVVDVGEGVGVDWLLPTGVKTAW